MNGKKLSSGTNLWLQFHFISNIWHPIPIIVHDIPAIIPEQRSEQCIIIIVRDRYVHLGKTSYIYARLGDKEKVRSELLYIIIELRFRKYDEYK